MGAALKLCEDLELSELAAAPPQLRLVASNDNASPDPERTGKPASRANLRLVEKPSPAETEKRFKEASSSEFTGKEEDVEVGLQYFGKRYLNPLLGRWVSADPLAVHAPGEADLNLYAYVSGSVLKNVDPLGLDKQLAEGVTQADGEATVEDGVTTVPEVTVYGDAGENSYNGGAGGGSSYLDEPGAQPGHEGAPARGQVKPEGGDQGESAQGLVIVGAGAACAAGPGVCAAGILLGKSLEAVQDSPARNENELKDASDASASAQFMGVVVGAVGKLARAAGRLFSKRAPESAAEVPAGQKRAETHGANWHKGSLDQAKDRFAGKNPIVTTTESGKRIFQNRETGIQVVEDMHGKYFRIKDPSLSGKRSYLDLHGRVPNNKTLPNGKQAGRSQGEYNAVTHFKIED